MLSKIRLFLVVSLFVLSGKLCAFCDWGRLSAEAEWIYFRPSVNSFIVQETSGIETASRNKIPAFEFASGWRVGLGWDFCDPCDGLFFRWTELNTTTSGFATGPLIVSDSPTLGSGTIRKRFRYHAFEGLYYHNLYGCECWNLNFLAGVQYAWLCKTEKFVGAGTTDFVRQNSHTWGVGPEVGFDLDWNFWNCFSIAGRGTYALLASRQHAGVAGLVGGVSVAGASDPLWTAVNAFDLRFGLRFASYYSCFNFYVEGGYEVISYNLALLNSNSLALSSDLANADMQGPYIAAGISY